MRYPSQPILCNSHLLIAPTVSVITETPGIRSVVILTTHLFVNSRVSVEEELKTLSCLLMIINSKVLANA